MKFEERSLLTSCGRLLLTTRVSTQCATALPIPARPSTAGCVFALQRDHRRVPVKGRPRTSRPTAGVHHFLSGLPRGGHVTRGLRAAAACTATRTRSDAARKTGGWIARRVKCPRSPKRRKPGTRPASGGDGQAGSTPARCCDHKARVVAHCVSLPPGRQVARGLRAAAAWTVTRNPYRFVRLSQPTGKAVYDASGSKKETTLPAGSTAARCFAGTCSVPLPPGREVARGLSARFLGRGGLRARRAVRLRDRAVPHPARGVVMSPGGRVSRPGSGRRPVRAGETPTIRSSQLDRRLVPKSACTAFVSPRAVPGHALVLVLADGNGNGNGTELRFR